MTSASPGRRVLILGGTTEARTLAATLDEAGVAVITSLAGRTTTPRRPAGAVRIGGFGGPDRLARWLLQHDVAAVVDATHPFAERISDSALRACTSSNVPLVRIERPAWIERPGDQWHRVDSLADAALLLPGLGRRVMLTIGRQGVSQFANVEACWFLVRCVEPPEPPLPPCHELLLARGPFTVERELRLLDQHQIDVVVTKDSGGTATEAKLEAARARGVPVVIVRRPAPVGVASVGEVGDAVAWVRSVLDAASVRTAAGSSHC